MNSKIVCPHCGKDMDLELRFTAIEKKEYIEWESGTKHAIDLLSLNKDGFNDFQKAFIIKLEGMCQNDVPITKKQLQYLNDLVVLITKLTDK